MITDVNPCDCARSLRKGKYLEHIRSFTTHLTEDMTSLMARCEFKCAAHYADFAQEAFDRECYHLAIWAGEQSCVNIDKLPKSYTVFKFVPQSIIARSHYEMGNNYTAMHISLKDAVQLINDAIRLEYFSFELRKLRATLCSHIIITNWISNPLFYIHFLQLISTVVIIIPILIVAFPWWILETFQNEEMTLSTETALIEQKYSYLWNILYSPFVSYNIESWILSTVYFLTLIIGIPLYYCCCCVTCTKFCIIPISSYLYTHQKLLILIFFTFFILIVTDWV